MSMIDSVEEASGGSSDFKRSRRKKVSESVAPLDFLPPHSIEAEQGVLGSILLSPNENMGICIEKLKAGADVFYDLRHQVIYQTLSEMYDAKVPMDLITIQQKLKDKQQLDGIGGLSYLASLPDMGITAFHLGHYAEIILQKFILRKLVRTCAEISMQVRDHEGEVDRLLDEVETKILRLSEERVEEKSVKIKDLVFQAIGKIEEYHQNQGMLSGLSSGFPDLDKMTTGLHGGEMVVLAARPSMGKTSLAMNFAEAVCLDQKQPVGVFSLEMTAESLVLRMLCSRAKVNLRKIRDGFFSERDFPKLTSSAGKLSTAPLFIDDTPGLSILQLRAKARRMHQQHGIKMFVIDYLQLLHSSASRAKENRQQEIADISNGVKALAKELSVPVIVLSQLNRDVEKEKNRKPRLSDLRESGAIEQDADLVLLLHKKEMPEGEDDGDRGEMDAVPVELIIAKQRNGPTGEVPLTFFKSYTRFENAAKVSMDDVPTE